MSAENPWTTTRRQALTLLLTTLLPTPLKSLPQSQTTTNTLETLLTTKTPHRPPNNPRSLQSDIIYPKYFHGRWNVSSELREVLSPAGVKLLGGEAAYESALQQVKGPALEYEARFVFDENGDVVADRAFNVEHIAKAAMGETAVLECSARGINNMDVSLGLNGGVLAISMETLGRDGKMMEDGKRLVAGEFVRQSVRIDGKDGRNGLRERVKEVETVCEYLVRNGRDDCFEAVQRTLTFLPRGDLRSVDAKGRAVDVRTYHLVYTRKR